MEFNSKELVVLTTLINFLFSSKSTLRRDVERSNFRFSASLAEVMKARETSWPEMTSFTDNEGIGSTRSRSRHEE